MAETCGGVGFCANRFAPTKRPDFNPNKIFNKWAEHRQQVKIDKLNEKAKTEGLSVQEKIELAANKLDVALKNGDFTPTVIYSA